MKSTRKLVSLYLLVNIAVWLSLIAVTHFMVFKPLFEDIDSWAKKTTEVGDLYKPASEGNPQALARLEQITHENNNLAYLMMIAIERKNAIKASGVDFNDPDAKIETIDVSKTQALLLQAVRELSDLELLALLSNESFVFDDDLKARKISYDKERSVWTRNATRFLTYSTFDLTTKENLLNCRNTLQNTYNSTLLGTINLRSKGTCSGVAAETSYSNLLERADVVYDLANKVEGYSKEWRDEPSAN